MELYKKLNNWIGWAVFALASTVYLLTAEPTASLWDCGEYIATAFKLQVGHPPGAPFFQLLANFFSLFAADTSQVAFMINAMSAFASSFTILFLFWTITHLSRKIVTKGDISKLEGGNLFIVLGSGLVGALTYTFTDSFWFSAVEGEVYALSSFFTAVVFWAMLKWEDVADKRHGFRWLILIAYLMGLSIGVHLLNLLTIPAMVFIYYFKKHKASPKGIIISGLLSIVLLAMVMYGIIPWIVIFAGNFEIFFVNTIGMPFHSGTIIYFIVLISTIVFGLYYTQKKKKLIANTIILGITFLIIGYSSFFILVIRSNANTPIDENNPEDATSMLAYLNREQYGDTPLFKGPYFTSPAEAGNMWEDKSAVYTKLYCVVVENSLPKSSKIKIGDRGLIKFYQYQKDAQNFIDEKNNPSYSIKQSYVLTDTRKNRVPTYDSKLTTIFPRMWSGSQPEYRLDVYKKYMGKNTKKVSYNGEIIEVPTFGANLNYFFKYQIGHMYMRYFMWNFAGRQNDIQGHEDKLHGNWISGISAIDNARLGDQSNLPINLKNNKGNNKYYFLPLILGLIGLYFHLARNYKDGIIVLSLFLMTGLAIVVYLNQYPYQPRERDYAYVASFYAFAIWIGIGVVAIYTWLKEYINPKATAIAVTSITLILVPGLLAQQNWDDHDRSGRYNTLNIAKNYLNSCEKNAILFTNGDNDTFPLWYAQEVEGVRTDIKIVNLSLFNTDWYVDQMARKTYEAEPIPISVERSQYIQGTNDAGYFIEENKVAKKGQSYNVRDIMNFYFSDSPKTKIKLRDGSDMNYLPTKNLYIKVDKDKVVKNGTVSAENADQIVDKVEWRVAKNMVQKNDLMMLEMLASFNWDRPIYYAITTGADAYMNLMKYFQLDGMAYRLVPIKSKGGYDLGSYGRVNTDVLYNNVMNVFKYDGLNDESLYFDEHHMRSIRNYRSNFARLANELVKEGDFERAKKVLDRCLETLPEKTVPYDYFMVPLMENYYKIGETEKANEIAKRLTEIAENDLSFFYTGTEFGEYINEKNNSLVIVRDINRLATQFKQDVILTASDAVFNKYGEIFGREAQTRR